MITKIYFYFTVKEKEKTDYRILNGLSLQQKIKDMECLDI